MHQPRAGLISDEITGQHRHIKIIALAVERVMAGQLARIDIADALKILNLRCIHDLRCEIVT